MATISKFYFHHAATPNTGTMPSGNNLCPGDTLTALDPGGATTARDATDTIGVANPDTESSITTDADTLAHGWGLRRFVSRPLAAQTLPSGNWTFSYARSESNLNSNQQIKCTVYTWRPSTGAAIATPTAGTNFAGTEPTVAATEQAESVTATMASVSGSTILDGDILVFDVVSIFTQGMATAYTQQFAYDGTTEASTTTCATFVTPPAALTLFSATVDIPDIIMAPPR